MNMASRSNLPLLAVIICLLLQSTEPIIVKWGLGLSLSAFELLIFRFIAGTLFVLPFIYKIRWVGFDNLKKLLPVCILFGLINILIYLSLQSLTAVTVITFLTITPSFVALVNQHKGKELLGVTFWPGLALSVVGVLLCIEILSKGFEIHDLQGLVFIILSLIGSTIYRTLLDGLTVRFGARLTSSYIFIITGLLALLFIPFVNFSTLSLKVVPFALWLGGAAILANISFLWAIKIMGSTRISVLSILQRPIVIVLAAVIFGESLTYLQVIGISMVLLGVWLAKVSRKPVLVNM